MASRAFHLGFTQGQGHVRMGLTLLGQGAATGPRLSEGDPNGTFFTITRSATGNLVLQTKDPYVAVVSQHVDASAGYQAKLGSPSQGVDGTFQIPIYTASSSNSVVGFTLTTQGVGYSGAPIVNITGGGGAGASATATAVAGHVGVVGVVAPGAFYTSAPTVGFSGTNGGTGAVATALLGSGAAVDLGVGASLHLDLTLRNSTVVP